MSNEPLLTVSRFLLVCVRNPREGLDRLRSKVANRLPETEMRGRYSPVTDWHRELHRALSADWPCDFEEGFLSTWSTLQEELSGHAEALGTGMDADIDLARAAWCVCSQLRPAEVVETGVARGITSRVILEAMSANEHGHLWSIDLPPLQDPWWRQSAVAVPERLRDRWTYIRGDSKRVLPGLLARLGQIDFFLHDSPHTTPYMTFEFENAARHLRSGGVLIADDVDSNQVFEKSIEREEWSFALVAEEGVKHKLFGIAVHR